MMKTIGNLQMSDLVAQIPAEHITENTFCSKGVLCLPGSQNFVKYYFYRTQNISQEQMTRIAVHYGMPL